MYHTENRDARSRWGAVAACALLASSAAGQLQFDALTKRHLPAILEGTSAVAVADIDGDGDPDLVFGNFGQSRIAFNLMRQLHSPSLVIPGSDYRLDVYARYGAPRLVDVALPYVSGATARVPLPPFGTFGLDPTSALPLVPFVIPQPAGVGSISTPVPNSPSLVGLPIHAQALLVQWPGAAFLTNVTSDHGVPR